MTIDVKELRELLAELAMPLQGIAASIIVDATSRLVAEIGTSRSVVTRDRLIECVNALGPLLDVYEAAQAWRDCACSDPASCGDGYTYHAHDCPTVETMRALVEAVDASRKESR